MTYKPPKCAVCGCPENYRHAPRSPTQDEFLSRGIAPPPCNEDRVSGSWSAVFLTGVIAVALFGAAFWILIDVVQTLLTARP